MRVRSAKIPTRTADGMTDDMNRKRYDSKKVSMADEPKFSPPATVADYINLAKKLLPFLWPKGN
jgi:hypothetical protein